MHLPIHLISIALPHCSSPPSHHQPTSNLFRLPLERTAIKQLFVEFPRCPIERWRRPLAATAIRVQWWWTPIRDDVCSPAFDRCPDLLAVAFARIAPLKIDRSLCPKVTIYSKTFWRSIYIYIKLMSSLCLYISLSSS